MTAEADVHITHPQCVRKALRLEWFLVGYNTLEAMFSVYFGIQDGSVSLVGFGLDSVIEVLATGVLIHRLSVHTDIETEEVNERRARRVVGWTFFALAAYVAFMSINHLLAHQAPSETLAGMVIAALSLLVMPTIGLRKIKLAKSMGSRALEVEARETMVCAYLSLILLVGLALYHWFGWWWVDSMAALGMVVFMLKEGFEAMEDNEKESC